MDCITKIEWWKAAGTRAIKTFAQTFVAMCGTGAIFQEIDWVMVASASGLAAVLSVMTSLAGLPEVCDDPAGKHVKLDYIDNEEEL